MRWLKRICLALTSLVALIAIIAAWVTWLSLPLVDGTVVLNGPAATIEIKRDQQGIPFINAGSEADAFFALGYVHAQDRLFQMDLMRRLGAGRLAEVLGPPALGSDEFMRTLGLYRSAKANLDVLDNVTVRTLERYAAGVNAWLENRSRPLPPEFQVLHYTPEPWVPADSLVWQKIMSLSLAGNWREELLRTELLQHLSPERMAELWPDAPPGSPTTVASAHRDVPLGLARVLINAIDAHAPPTLASNVWAVDGQHTASGKPILANDPHLGFQAPIVWYLARLEWPGHVRAGATTPGVPFQVIGHNGRIAWGLTTTHADLQDLFIERLTGDGGYLTPSGSEPFEERRETISVRFADPVALTVRSTRHGPVVSDLAGVDMAGQNSGTVLALSATMLRNDDRTASGIDRLGRARSVDGARAALALFEGPQQNFVYADVDGGIGFTSPALIPIRRAGNGTVPVPGETGAYDWLGWVSYDELPHSLRPESGRLVNANNRPMPLDYPHLIAATFPESYRAERIGQRLDTLLGLGTGASVADMAAIQLDTRSAMARDVLPLLLDLAVLDDENGQRALDLLSDWDGTMDRNRSEPLIFLTWLEAIKRTVLADELGTAYDSFRGPRVRLIRSILTDRQHWCDDITSQTMETCSLAVSRALEEALAWLAERPETNGTNPSEWRFSRFHRARFPHPLFGLIPGLSALTTVEIETDGGEHTVNRGGYRSARGHAPFRHSHGAGLRAVFDLADLDRSLFMIAVGQSGHPASNHFDDLNRPWRDGEVLTLPAGGPRNPASTLVLEPLFKAGQTP